MLIFSIDPDFHRLACETEDQISFKILLRIFRDKYLFRVDQSVSYLTSVYY